MTLFPTVTLYGALEVVGDGTLDEDGLELHFQSSPRHRPQLIGTVPCPVVQEDDSPLSFSCEVPAGTLDLRFHHTGFASVSRWGVELPHRQEPYPTPSLNLRPGASVMGFLQWSGDPPKEARITLEPSIPRGQRHPAEGSFRLLRQETSADERGFFQLVDVDSGLYTLTATADGYAKTRREGVRVISDRETRVRPALHLQPPARLDLLVRPPTHPMAKPWRVTLVHEKDNPDGSTLRNERVEEDGSWSSSEIQPGAYRLRIESAPERIWHSERVEVGAGPNPVTVDLPIVPITGQVTFGGEPVRARLFFGSLRGEERLRWYSDTDGYFQGWVPYPGVWPIAARLQRGADSIIEPVEIKPTASGKPVWLDIELPYTYLPGQVVDTAGQPVPGVQLEVYRLATSDKPPGTTDQPAHALLAPENREPKPPPKPPATRSGEVKTDDEGRFELYALPPGTYVVSVIDLVYSGDSIVVDVPEGDAAPEARFVVESVELLRGRVVSTKGPVVGASVKLITETPTPRRSPIRRALTRVDGSFEVMVPASTETVVAVVLPPGHAVDVRRFTRPEEGLLEIPVQSLGGSLTVAVPPSEDPSALWRHSRLLRGDLRISLSMLRPWLESYGQRPAPGVWQLPHLAPGPWSVCDTRTDECVAGVLAPSGLLELTLPIAKRSD